VIALSLAEIAAATGGRVVAPSSAAGVETAGVETTDVETTGVETAGVETAGVWVTTVSVDSRQVLPGALFAALCGERTDGHDHAADAVTRGARALLVARPLALPVAQLVVPDVADALRALAGEVRRRVAPRTVAITGSVGKTTVKDLTAAAIGAGRRTHAAQGSFNNELGVPLTLLGLDADTEVLVAELGARHVGDIATLARLVAPDVAIVTAVAAVHLEIFGTIDAVARAKAELVEALPADGLAILNAADRRVAAMAPLAPAVLRVAAADASGHSPDADLVATEIRLDRLARPHARVHTPWGPAELTLPVAGRHQIVNALFALAAAGHLGVDVRAAAAALAAAPVSPWRGEIVEAGGVVIVNDAYNASPTAVLAALDTLVSVARTGTTTAVLGVMAEIGPTAQAEHRRVGRAVAAAGVDRLVVVGAQARGIARGAREHGAPEVVEVADAAAAVAHLRGVLAPGDVVLVKASRVAGLESVAGELLAAAAPDTGTEAGP
jgi:UDP-N-acetylmuramoyl-tripeptide--D-alanyl-D-alanine ligase